ncbi:MAG: hypothetical protein ACE5FT_06245 [Candidatus Nanoarchaeia archaeon]
MKIDIVDKQKLNESNHAILTALKDKGVNSSYIRVRDLAYRFEGKNIEVYHKKKHYVLPNLIVPREMNYGGSSL